MAQDERTLILDGAINLDRWNSNKLKKILWILRETNECPRDNDLRKLLNELASVANPNKIYNKWKATYGLVVKVSYGLLNGYNKLGDWADDVNAIRGVLQDIAVINVNKYAGVSTSDLKKLFGYAEEFHQTILDQINSLNPDIIILGGVESILSKWLPKNDSRRKWISTTHPGQRLLSHKDYYERIIKVAEGLTI